MTDTQKSKLEFQHKDEVEDHKKYLELADEFEKDGCDEIAGVLRDIAHDEKTHRDILSHILEHNK